MNLSTINLILWIPFVIAMVITGMIFMIGGYKKGLRRAIVSLGATIVGAVISILLAKVLAPIIAPGVFKVIPLETIFGPTVPVNLVSMFLESIIQVVVTQALFFLFLIFITTICRLVMAYFWGQNKSISDVSDENDPIKESNSKKWAGLGVGFANALIFSLLLVLPVYGTIAAYIPSVTKMYSLASASTSNIAGGPVQTEDELLALLEGIGKHPAVQMSGNGPVADVYDSLSETKVNDAIVNYSKMAKTLEAVMTEVEAMKTIKNEEELAEHGKELLTILRSDVIEEDWAYNLAIEIKASLKDYVPQMDAEEFEIINKMLDSVCSSKEKFEEVGVQVLDSLIKTLEGKELDEEEEKTLMKMFAEILQDAGVNE